MIELGIKCHCELQCIQQHLKSLTRAHPYTDKLLQELVVSHPRLSK